MEGKSHLSFEFPTDQYLSRLQLKRQSPNLNFLKRLHYQHLIHIPFENLDIHYGRKIILDIKMMAKKVLTDNRGGLCFELNALFYHLLLQLGFDAKLGSARVFKDDGLTPEFDHMMVFVNIGDDVYLCDVGFGKSFVYPKKISLLESQLDYTTYFRFEQNPDEEWILKKSSDNAHFESVYLFEIKERKFIEFLARCNFHQEDMSSYFKQHKIISQLRPDGR